MRSIIILGGYGNFGGRIARALSKMSDVNVYIAGRSQEKAKHFCDTYGGNLQPLSLEMDDFNFSSRIRSFRTKIVIHTAGPFQTQNYQVAEKTAAGGSHYIDLSDSRRFVCDFKHNMQSHFNVSKTIGISGASTVPALSSAIVDYLSKSLCKINEIDICIAPGHLAPRGLATMRAILDYCGKQISVLENNQWIQKAGWGNLTPVKFSKMSSRVGSLCDIPDLELFKSVYPSVKTITFNAALELKISQYALYLLSKLKSSGFNFDLQRLAPVLESSAHLLNPFGTGLGGMRVLVKGEDLYGNVIEKTFNITAPDRNGPEIPAMPAIILARKLIYEDHQLRPGAYTASNLLNLDEFKPEFEKWKITTDES